MIPDKSTIEKILQNSLANLYILDVKNHKIIIPNNFFTTIPIKPDGNCFYLSLSKFMIGSDVFHLFFRNCIYNYIKTNKEQIIGDNEFIN